MQPTQQLELRFDSLLLCRVTEAFCVDGTWHGICHRAQHDRRVPERVTAYIDFCEDWNERLKLGSAASDMFDRFSDVVTSNLWSVRRSDGTEEKLPSCPVFFRGGEVSWAAT